ncbi:MAG TPA: LLM class flavin-dependent oxidoreductase, partial [Jatrophihabitans sp.]|nr:LLM class flavin-dependent oxidoreductase [Jatrophihabitans sp.]
GYRRFWVAEHHNMPAIASSAPAVLIAHLAAATSTIRVGSGGVMLPNRPHAMVAVNVICADTDEDARYLAAPGWLSFLRLRAGRPTTMPTPDEAAEHRFTPDEAAFLEERLAGQVLGSPSTVRSRLTDLLRRTGADELMVTSQVYDIADRLRCYELLAQLSLDPKAGSIAV